MNRCTIPCNVISHWLSRSIRYPEIILGMGHTQNNLWISHWPLLLMIMHTVLMMFYFAVTKYRLILSISLPHFHCNNLEEYGVKRIIRITRSWWYNHNQTACIFHDIYSTFRSRWCWVNCDFWTWASDAKSGRTWFCQSDRLTRTRVPLGSLRRNHRGWLFVYIAVTSQINGNWKIGSTAYLH